MSDHEKNVNGKDPASLIAEDLVRTMEANRIPDPGLYRDLPEGQYHNVWKAISSSLLRELKRSPAHAYQYMTAPAAPTDAMQLGTAVHAAILQPDLFDSIYVGTPKLDMRTTIGKAAMRCFMDAHPGKRFLPIADFNKVKRMRDAAMSSATVRRLVEGRGDFELSFAWRDEKTGLIKKGRADRVSWEFAGGTIVDIKSCQDARQFAFEKTIFKRSYHNQGGLYVEGVKAQKLAIKHYSIIAIESDAPHALAVYRMQDEVIEAAQKENRELVDRFDECQKSGTWPGYDEGIVDIGLPRYAWNELEG